ncbi:MAG: methyltransferase domain-containing protein [Aeromicrobium sp.]|uniref:class I SAM-dependent methyltransferase n=1 Tax=Aeromicrobium sp. TaxID=1871063 RepID=UPI003C572F8C
MSTQAPTTDQIRTAWDSIAPGFDDHVSPLTIALGEHLVERLEVGPGARFLDVAAGSGALALPAARRGATTTAVDLAPIMIERLTARAAAEGLSNLRGQVMDGVSLDFPVDTFDVTVSLNGVSLFPDIDAGLAELVRVTKPGGRVVVATFGPMPHTEFVTFFMSAMQTTVPGLAPMSPEQPPLPFQVSDPERLRGKLLDAGLTMVEIETTPWNMTFESARHYWDATTSSNPIAAQMTAGLSAQRRDDVLQVLDGMLRERSGGHSEAVLRNVMTIGTGSKPAQH